MAHDGAAALELSQAQAFDVILLDIGLPSVDGYEVARRIRERGGEPRPRLVGISGYGFEADRRRAMDAGFDAYLVKPVDPQGPGEPAGPMVEADVRAPPSRDEGSEGAPAGRRDQAGMASRDARCDSRIDSSARGRTA